MPLETLKFEIKEKIASIIFNRPDNANSLNAKMAEELFDISLKCARNKDIGALVVTSEGKTFSSGGDLKEFNAPPGGRQDEHIAKVASNLHNALIRFAHMDAPVIVAVNGIAAGGGFSIALSGDYILASESASFVSAYTASGLTPDGSSTYFLSKHIGLLKAKELFLFNRMLGAKEALEWGFVNEVVADNQLHAKTFKLAKKIASGPTKAFGGVKRLLMSSFSNPIEAQLDRETLEVVGTMDTYDGPHGIASFLDKKPPDFKGE